MSHKWSKGTFPIILTTTKSERTGYVSGPWGIHKEEKAWILTLIPSGMAVRDSTTLARAKEVVDILSKAKGWEAVVTTADTTDEQTEAFREVLRLGY